ncbi:hypothetical protein [Arthrobacter sp. CP30]
MIVAKKWVAAGSTATLLAGGLFLGAPMAAAAPGDAACLQASTQFNAALGLAGVDVTFVNQFEAATAAVVEAAAAYEAVAEAALTSAAAVAAEAQIVTTDGVLNAAGTATATAVTARATAEAEFLTATPEGDPDQDPDVIDAQQALLDAQDAESRAAQAYEAALAAYEAAVGTPDVFEAEEALVVAGEQADALLEQLSGNEALAAELLDLFKAFLAACDASAIGVDPVVPVVVAPVTPAPVVPGTGAAPAPVAKAPVASNKGLNVQTAVTTEDNNPAVALIAALLAVGVAVPVATAARMRRLERAER